MNSHISASDWIKKNSVGEKISYLADNSTGIIIEANLGLDSYLILFDDGIESAQPWRLFILDPSSLKRLEIGEKVAIEAKARADKASAEAEAARVQAENKDKTYELAKSRNSSSLKLNTQPNFPQDTKEEILKKFISQQFPYFYHMTHIDNLETILKYGILSHQNAHEKGVLKVDISDPSAQRWRALNEPIYHRAVHCYVPFYLNPKNPMFYRLRDISDKLVILRVTRNILTNYEHIFTDGNAASRDTLFSKNENIIEGSLDVLLGSSWTDFNDGKRRRCAEVLIYPIVRPIEIDIVICKSNQLAERISLSSPLPTSVDSNMFF